MSKEGLLGALLSISLGFNMLNPTGVFCNLEHVASPSVELHVRFLNAIGYTPKTESTNPISQASCVSIGNTLSDLVVGSTLITKTSIC